jgi:PAS domain S-box-containing protein
MARVLVGGDWSRHEVLIGLLRAEGYEAGIASDREAVCRLVRETSPALILINNDLLEPRDGTDQKVLSRELDLSGACVIRLTEGPGESEVEGEGLDPWSLPSGLGAGQALFRLKLFLRVHRAEAAERLQTRRLEEMVRIQDEIASVKTDPKGIMEIVAERAQQLTGADGAAVLMVSGDSLGAEAATGMLVHLRGQRSRIDGTVSALCLQSDEVFECGDVENDERFRIEAEREGGYGSSLIVPLRYQYNSVGVLKVVSRRREAFLSAEGHALQFVAYFMATAINQAVALSGKQALLAEHTKTILALRESEERFRSAFDYASIGMALIRTDGRWLKVNHTLCGVVGYSEAELKELSFDSLTHPEDLPLHRDNVLELLSGKVTSFQVEERCFHKSGSLVWILLNVSLHRDVSSNPLNFIAQIQDITERKRAEDAFRMQARVLANMSEGVCLADEDGVIVYTNRAEDRIFGYATGELKGQHMGCLMVESGESGQISVSEVIQEVLGVIKSG